MKKVIVGLKIVAILIALFFACVSLADLGYVAGHFWEDGLALSSANLAVAMIKATIAIVFAILSK